ncbi:Transcription factor PCL1 [Camellia lanceoleosa]|uniref:Transcription factor PCL1 n=1 Tax=Camellia lanceoleosa TaxID=1840588 RepID=A0ACC0HHK7_9ERIC|nr:Transcription factor PCL1 [Camellia lanceoleosa]
MRCSWSQKSSRKLAVDAIPRIQTSSTRIASAELLKPLDYIFTHKYIRDENVIIILRILLNFNVRLQQACQNAQASLPTMSVDGLTHENMVSHLQKYRLYLKRMQGISTGGGGDSEGLIAGSDPATDHLFASSPMPSESCKFRSFDL